MMTKRMTTIRLSEHTDRQLSELAHIGNHSEVIALAIDRLHQEEVTMERRRYVYAQWRQQLGHDGLTLELIRYGKVLVSFEATSNVSGAIEHSNERHALANANDWAEANGYDGIKYLS
jgi:hypothetical protein